MNHTQINAGRCDSILEGAKRIAANRSTGRKLDDASIRRILRRYGAKFEFTEGEVPDEEVTPPAPPTP